MRAPVHPQPPKFVYCDECGKPFYGIRHDQIFCSGACKKARHARRVQGGLKLYDLAMRWRIEQPKDAWGDLTTEVDRLAFDERERRRKRKEVVDASHAGRAREAAK